MQSGTLKQIEAIISWRDRHRLALYEEHGPKYLACGIDRVLAVGDNYEEVKAAAISMGQPFIVDRMFYDNVEPTTLYPGVDPFHWEKF